MASHHFTKATPVDEPVEVRILLNSGTKVLTAWRTDRGTVAYSLSLRGGDRQESLSNLQSPSLFPGKAVPGWQAEVIAYADAGLGYLAEIR